MLTVVDCNNFWSPSGGGVRRYHLEKLAYYSKREDVHYIFMMQDSSTYTEVLNESTVIEHVEAFKVPGNWEYRFLMRSKPILALINKYTPDIIEVGSPYVMPYLVCKAVKRSHSPKTTIVGFWHADFPVTYVQRFFKKFSIHLASIMESLAWAFARKSYRSMQMIFSSSTLVINRMTKQGMQNIQHLPLGVDLELFNPSKRDYALRAQYQAGEPRRLILFFPHRFSDEKGIRTILEGYTAACRTLPIEPALVFAGTGPDLPLVEKYVASHEHIHYVGFINSTEEMARWHASNDIGFALSSGETFGLSIVESLASGVPLIAVSDGAALEHAEHSQAGLVVAPYNSRELADALITLVTMSNRSHLQSNARTYAETLSWQHCFSKQISLYHQALSQEVTSETV
ncbi:MAG: glycosyltransferase [Fibrobacterales bacterium]